MIKQLWAKHRAKVAWNNEELTRLDLEHSHGVERRDMDRRLAEYAVTDRMLTTIQEDLSASWARDNG